MARMEHYNPGDSSAEEPITARELQEMWGNLSSEFDTSEAGSSAAARAFERVQDTAANAGRWTMQMIHGRWEDHNERRWEKITAESRLSDHVFEQHTIDGRDVGFHRQLSPTQHNVPEFVDKGVVYWKLTPAQAVYLDYLDAHPDVKDAMIAYDKASEGVRNKILNMEANRTFSPTQAGIEALKNGDNTHPENIKVRRYTTLQDNLAAVGYDLNSRAKQPKVRDADFANQTCCPGTGRQQKSESNEAGKPSRQQNSQQERPTRRHGQKPSGANRADNPGRQPQTAAEASRQDDPSSSKDRGDKNQPGQASPSREESSQGQKRRLFSAGRNRQQSERQSEDQTEGQAAPPTRRAPKSRSGELPRQPSNAPQTENRQPKPRTKDQSEQRQPRQAENDTRRSARQAETGSASAASPRQQSPSKSRENRQNNTGSRQATAQNSAGQAAARSAVRGPGSPDATAPGNAAGNDRRINHPEAWQERQAPISPPAPEWPDADQDSIAQPLSEAEQRIIDRAMAGHQNVINRAEEGHQKVVANSEGGHARAAQPAEQAATQDSPAQNQEHNQTISEPQPSGQELDIAEPETASDGSEPPTTPPETENVGSRGTETTDPSHPQEQTMGGAEPEPPELDPTGQELTESSATIDDNPAEPAPPETAPGLQASSADRSEQHAGTPTTAQEELEADPAAPDITSGRENEDSSIESDDEPVIENSSDRSHNQATETGQEAPDIAEVDDTETKDPQPGQEQEETPGQDSSKNTPSYEPERDNTETETDDLSAAEDDSIQATKAVEEHGAETTESDAQETAQTDGSETHSITPEKEIDDVAVEGTDAGNAQDGYGQEVDDGSTQEIDESNDKHENAQETEEVDKEEPHAPDIQEPEPTREENDTPPTPEPEPPEPEAPKTDTSRDTNETKSEQDQFLDSIMEDDSDRPEPPKPDRTPDPEPTEKAPDPTAERARPEPSAPPIDPPDTASPIDDAGLDF